MHGLVLRHSILAGVHHLTLQASLLPPKRGSVCATISADTAARRT
jgi:hypothetical protein